MVGDMMMMLMTYLLFCFVCLGLSRRLNDFEDVDACEDEVKKFLKTVALLVLLKEFFGIKGHACVNDFQQAGPSVEQFRMGCC